VSLVWAAGMPSDQENSGLISPLFPSPRLWDGNGEGDSLLPSSKQVPSKPIIEGRKSQDKQCYGFFVFVMALFMIQSFSSIFSANYELPNNFAECEKRVQEESIQVKQ
jgi:hypothetical protein